MVLELDVGAFLVEAGQPAIADHVGGKDRSESSLGSGRVHFRLADGQSSRFDAWAKDASGMQGCIRGLWQLQFNLKH